MAGVSEKIHSQKMQLKTEADICSQGKNRSRKWLIGIQEESPIQR